MSMGGGLAAAAGCAAPRAASGGTDVGPARKPNVVIVLIDDMGWTDTGCYGSRYCETPNIDRLASEGVRFTNGYAACAVCSPTRASVMTGRYPARLGITDWIRARYQGGDIPADGKNPSEYVSEPEKALSCPPNALWMELDEVTIAEILKAQGYTTCHIGKWHLGPDTHYPDTQGFDYNIGGCDFGQPPSYFDPYSNPRQGQIPTLEPRQEGEYLTDREADEAAKFIRAHRNTPFFLYLAHYAVHTPLQAKQKLIAKYKDKRATEQDNATYAAMIESVDNAMGAVLQALNDAGVADNTIVVFTSDNGGLLGSTSNVPLRSGKGYPYEGGIREPFIVRWPGVVKPGTANDAMVCTIDLLPTVCAATGAPLPDRPVDGVSILPLLRGKKKLDREALFWHFPHYRGEDVSPYGIVRKGDWKLIKWYEGPTNELYNLADDLSETTNLAGERPEKVEELDALLAEWLGTVGAKMPVPNPEYKKQA